MRTKLVKLPPKVTIIGAGPAGLGCGYELVTKGTTPADITIVDKNDCVGGLARTHNYKGYLFDVGPHRFFTKNDEIQAFWETMLGEEFIKVPRLTRMLYKKKLFLYPVEFKDVITKMNPAELATCLASYAKAKMTPRSQEPKTFEEWITKNFGNKLYTIFFKTYTEKVWGIPGNEIGAEWAAQRIKNLDFAEVIRSAISGKSKAKSLVDVFYYPTKGAGYLYEKMASAITVGTAEIKLDTSVASINHDGKSRIHNVTTDCDGQKTVVPTDYLFSSMPLTHFITALNPAPPPRVLNAAKKLYYRDHITVNLVVNKADLFPDNWIYVHEPGVKMARIANYGNFSSKMIKTKGTSALSVEYFVFKGDALWQKSDGELIGLATSEMEQVGLLNRTDVTDGFVMRETESYPTYYMGHKRYFDILKKYVSQFENLQLIGRGGMYKYDNQDHAIYSGFLAARNFLAGNKQFDVWEINEDAEYLEEKKSA